MAFVLQRLSNPGIPEGYRQAALDRIFADPGIPDNKKTTSSFWLQRPHPTLSTAKSAALPNRAETVIIGSGITAASVARTLLETGDPAIGDVPSIVILEARDLCSGATGRNGGHILETADDYGDLADEFGDDIAKAIMSFRLSHLQTILDVADELCIREECQARKVRFLSAYFSEETWKAAKDRLKRFKDAMPVESLDWACHESPLPTEFNLPRASGVISGPAGALWPYKFVTGVFDDLVQRFPNNIVIETSTPVTEIRATSERFPYTITTPRGVIQCRHVVHCTNGHVSHLVPQIKGCIYPVRGQMSAQNPGEGFLDYGRKHSWLMNYDTGFDYLTQLPNDHPSSNGEMMFGGGFAQGKNGGIDDLGVSTDHDLSLDIDIHLSGALAAIFGHENWGKVDGPSVKSMWTGTMGFSADGMPWVGKLPSSWSNQPTDDVVKGAQWVSAGFSGEGMVQAWLCGKALGRMILIDDGKVAVNDPLANLDWFPNQMRVTEERIRRSMLPRKVTDTRHE